jgi:uncharacterized protein
MSSSVPAPITIDAFGTGKGSGRLHGRRVSVYIAGMFILELAFTDDPRRLEGRPGHRDRLVELHADGRLVMAGPLENDSGAVLVFNTDRDELTQIMGADPYYTGPGVEVISIREWVPIVGAPPAHD